jgi:hypothetical protein
MQLDLNDDQTDTLATELRDIIDRFRSESAHYRDLQQDSTRADS